MATTGTVATTGASTLAQVTNSMNAIVFRK